MPGCKGCGNKKKTNLTGPTSANVNTNFSEHEDFFWIKYYPVGGTQARFVKSPTDIVFEFGMNNYGFKGPGKEFWVHRLDIEAEPNVFLVHKDDLHKFGVEEKTEIKVEPIKGEVSEINEVLDVKTNKTEDEPDTEEEVKATKFTAKPVNKIHSITKTKINFESMGAAVKDAKLIDKKMTGPKLKKIIEEGIEIDGFKWYYL